MASLPRDPRVTTDWFERLVQGARDHAIFFLDTEGHILSWNRGAEQIKGYHPKEILGQHFSVFYTKEDQTALRPQYGIRIARLEGRYEDAGWRVRRDGTTFWAHVSIQPLRREEDGELLGFFKITRDLTQQKQAQEALRQAEERYRLLLEGVRDHAIYMLDPQGHVVSWNAGAQRITGYAADEIVGEHFRIFYTEDDCARGHPEAELQNAMRDGRYEETGWRVRKDGRQFFAEVTITPLHDDTGRLRGFAKVTRDLSERMEAETRAREHAQRIDEVTFANRELEAFSRTVAHDLRAPLRAVHHLTEDLLETEPLTPEGRKSLEAMRESAGRMSGLLEDLLRLSMATQAPIRRQRVDLSALAREAAAEAEAREKGRVGVVTVDEGLWTEADPRLLRVLLDNLLSNALKFTRGAPEYRIHVGATGPSGTGPFFVRDNGVGFDPSKARGLFEPFRRFHAASAVEGTGVGLATVRRIAERHGGRVWVESAPAGGATFYFTLPPSGGEAAQ